MKKNFNLFLTLFSFLLLFTVTDKVKAISFDTAKAIIEYSGSNGSENDVALTSGCEIAYEYFTIGSEKFYDKVNVDEVAAEYCKKYQNNENILVYNSCLSARRDAAITKLADIRRDAKDKGYTLDSNEFYSKSLGYVKGCYRYSYVGVRVSIVNSDGTQKNGTKILDYWATNPNKIFGNIKKSNSLRSLIVNGSNPSFNIVPSIGGSIDSKMGDYTQARITLKKEVMKSSNTKQILSNGYLKKLGINKWTDFDDDDHILFEPLFVVTIKNTNYVGTGTEIFYLLMYQEKDATGLQFDFITQITNKMVLVENANDKKDDTDQTYTLNSKGAKYSTYDNIPQNKNELKNDPNLVLRKANGYAMELIWLKPYISDKKPLCCIPCDTGDKNLNNQLANYLKNYNQENGTNEVCDPYNCEGEDEIATGIDSNGNLVCEPYTPDVPEPCCIPSRENEYCCNEIENICKEYSNIDYDSYYNMYCNNDDKCEFLIGTPRAQTGICTTDNSKNTSVFSDPLYASNSEDLNGTAYTLAQIGNSKTITNKFMSFYYNSSADVYLDSTTDYCKTYCQEVMKITLPDNYPYSNAGRYFYWDIKSTGDEHDIVLTSIEKVCTTDIDLDKWYFDYSKLLENVNNAGETLAGCIGTGNKKGDESIGGSADCEAKAKQDVDNAKKALEACMAEASKGDCPMKEVSVTANCRPYCTGNACCVTHTVQQKDCSSKCSSEEQALEDANEYYSKIVESKELIKGARGELLSGFVGKLVCGEPNVDESDILNIDYSYETFQNINTYNNNDILYEGTYNNTWYDSSACIFDKNDNCNVKNIFTTNDEFLCKNINRFEGFFGQNGLYSYNVYTKADCKYSGGKCNWTTMVNSASNLWYTAKHVRYTVEGKYKLKNNINACVCKDGTIINANDDGSCECPDMSSKIEIIADISNQYSCYFEWKTTKYYTTISSGNLSVEYMTPTGLYPLSLDYSNIGTNGHFSQLMKDGVLKNVSHCEDGTCHYSDEDGKCYFIVDNEVIIDGGFIEDSICPEGICKPDDKCTGGDCSNFCEVGKCSNDSSVGGMEIIYRQIDLNNPFPDREPGKNWQGNEEIITNNRDVDGNKLYSSNLEPIYSITMTPSTIKEIRKVNNALNYDYSSISTMLFDDNKITGGVSYVLRGNLKDIAERTGGSFTINLNDANTSGRFDDIINNTKVDNSGNLATCREKASEVLK